MNATAETRPWPLRLRLMVIVSTDPSDVFFLDTMARRFELVGAVVEHQREPPDPRPRWRKALDDLSSPARLANRTAAWLSSEWHGLLDRLLLLETPPVFGGDLNELLRQDDWPVLRLEGSGKLNDPETVAWVAARGPDLIVVCGAGLLRKEILAVPRIGVLNLHGGLVQFYRGLFTTDWAVYDGKPECVGATVHFVTLGIDDGGVVFQARPRLEITDDPSKCYEKVVGLGVQMMTAAIQLIDRDQAPEPVTPERGRLCRARDFTPATKRRLWRRWEDAMPEYVGDREPRDTRVESRLVNQFVPDQVGDFVDGES